MGDQALIISEGIVKQHLDTLCQKYHEVIVADHVYTRGSCTLTVVGGQESEEHDIGGDMNHVVRVCVVMECEVGRRPFSLIVKIAPNEVLFLKEKNNESQSLDPNKIELEYSALCRFHEILPGCVPRPYLLDRSHKAIIMEDLFEFHKLEDQLTGGVVKEHTSAIEAAMACVGQVHRTTWLDALPIRERKELMEQFENPGMKSLMAEFLFDRPFNSSDKSNSCNPQLVTEITKTRSDSAILKRVAELRQDFLQQRDCLCHGDFSCDNIMVRRGQFKIVDLEFASVGLRAYDIGLLLETLIFRLFCHSHCGSEDTVRCLHQALHRGLQAYEAEVGAERFTSPSFVGQVCGLIGCEQLWKVFGSYSIEEFGRDPGPERKLLALGRQFLLNCTHHRGIVANIDSVLTQFSVLPDAV